MPPKITIILIYRNCGALYDFLFNLIILYLVTKPTNFSTNGIMLPSHEYALLNIHETATHDAIGGRKFYGRVARYIHMVSAALILHFRSISRCLVSYCAVFSSTQATSKYLLVLAMELLFTIITT